MQPTSSIWELFFFLVGTLCNFFPRLEKTKITPLRKKNYQRIKIQAVGFFIVVFFYLGI